MSAREVTLEVTLWANRTIIKPQIASRMHYSQDVPLLPIINDFVTMRYKTPWWPFLSNIWNHVSISFSRSFRNALQWRQNECHGVSITGISIVYSAVCSGVDKWKQQSSASLAFVMGIHRWPVNSPLKEPVTRKMFPFDGVIMVSVDCSLYQWLRAGLQ